MTTSEKPEPRIQEARLNAFLKLLPAIQVFTFIDAVLLVVYLWSDANPGFLLSWLGAITVHCLVWGFFRNRKPIWMYVLALDEGLLFAVFLIGTFPGASPARAVVLAAFAVGMLSAGTFSKMTLPGPALVFTTTLSAGSVFALATSGLSPAWVPIALLLGLAFGTSILGRTLSKNFDARVEAEIEVGRQKTLVSDLLDDFGESTSEGLWETDPGGRLTLVTPRLATLFGSGSPLEGRPLTDTLHWQTLVEKGTAFRDVEVPFETPGGRRWWSLTGKPRRERETIVGWRGVASDVTDQRQRELEVLRMSRQDGLTGLLNRQAFRTLLDELLAPGLPPRPRGLALIDLVDFKDVNESRGHTFGDALLAAVAHRLGQVLPESVLVARLDGDEFALIFPMDGSSVNETKRALERLLEALKEPFTTLGDRFAAGFRIGASFAPQDASTSDQWLRCADLALRTAKTLGRNQLVVFTPDLMVAFRRRNTLRNDLREAIAHHELWLAFQPLVELSQGRITGFEALVRWNHPVEGTIPPSDFIPLAEESELILTLGLWVLETACQEAVDWPDIKISVNLSGVQLRDETLADEVAGVLRRTGFDPQRLILEVTESALVKDNSTVRRTLTALKDQGIQLALDDFGTGYSALSYLQTFPFDKLKIDQSFVRPLSSRRGPPALLASIVALARALGLSTTAEGIEDEIQRKVLMSAGCDEGQGYLFSRPVPASAVPALLAVVVRA